MQFKKEDVEKVEQMIKEVVKELEKRSKEEKKK